MSSAADADPAISAAPRAPARVGDPRRAGAVTTRSAPRIRRVAVTDPVLLPTPASDVDVVTATAAAHIEVRRSPRRRRTVSAYREGDSVVVLLPMGLSRPQEQRWIRTMLERLDLQERRRHPDDTVLEQRARELSDRFLGGLAVPLSVRWVDNQGSRWGSCTPGDGSIRLSARLRGVPTWVLDYVLLHELAHLLEPAHGPAFWCLLENYPRTERARGFLEGVDFNTRSQALDPPG